MLSKINKHFQDVDIVFDDTTRIYQVDRTSIKRFVRLFNINPENNITTSDPLLVYPTTTTNRYEKAIECNISRMKLEEFVQ